MARYFVTLCAFALFVAVATAIPAEEDETLDFSGLFTNEGRFYSNEDDDLEVENQRGFGSFLEGFFENLKKYAKNEYIDRINRACVFDVPVKCGVNVLKLKKYYNCALKHFKDNEELCLKPKVY